MNQVLTDVAFFLSVEDLPRLEVRTMADESEEGRRNRFWGECYEKVRVYLLRVATHLLLTHGGPIDDAEDMVSEGIIRAYKSLSLDMLAQTPADRRLKVIYSYLFRAVRSAVHDHLFGPETSIQMESLSDLNVDIAYTPSYLDPLDSTPVGQPNSRVVALRALLARLPRLTPNDLEILTLRFGDGLSVPDIHWYLSNVKQSPLKKTTVYMRYNRALNKLLKFLSESPEFAAEFPGLKARFLEGPKQRTPGDIT
jgi:DNA-directed RNA polymerase specialized sigma24 family protein